MEARCEAAVKIGSSRDPPADRGLDGDRSVLGRRFAQGTALVRVITDDGRVGVGESLLGYFLPEAVPMFVDYFAPLVVGEDPRDTEALGNGCTRAASTGAARAPASRC